jgi:hypothetical protein
MHTLSLENEIEIFEYSALKIIRDYELILLRKGKVVPVFNQLNTTPKRRVGEWIYSSTILDLATIGRWVVSFRPQPLYPEENIL